jgi:hypothetical protein
MTFVKTGKFDPNALETRVERENLIERTKIIALDRLAYLLGCVGELGTETLDMYIDKLTAHYQNCVTVDSVATQSIDLAALVERDILKEHMELARAIFNYHLQLLNLPEDADWQVEPVQVFLRDALRSGLILRYDNLQVLVEILGRTEAFRLYKRFVSQYIRSRQTEEDAFESVEALLEDRLQSNAESPTSWVLMQGIIGDGKYAYKNENCLWVDALCDLPDAEIKYYVCCYGDFQGAKSWNRNFVLTMEHTIAQGDAYCSRVVHDTRVDWHLGHPPKEFWDEMQA